MAEIELGGPEDIDSLRDLWLELHHHHAEVAASTGPFADDDSSWQVRSGSYREWLSDPRSFLLLARDDGRLVGYACVRVFESGDDLRDAWVVPDVIAELETLVVSVDQRGAGVGNQLLDEMDAELARRGIDEVQVGLIPGNDGAQRLYERRGFEPRWLVLFSRRPEAPEPEH
jgi:ribosomal protein S18 acetylase RimI-like enzyme